MRLCAYCQKPLPENMRRDGKYCRGNSACRVYACRERRRAARRHEQLKAERQIAARTKAQALVLVLKARGIELSVRQRRKVLACTDLAVLDQALGRAAVATTRSAWISGVTPLWTRTSELGSAARAGQAARGEAPASPTHENGRGSAGSERMVRTAPPTADVTSSASGAGARVPRIHRPAPASTRPPASRPAPAPTPTRPPVPMPPPVQQRHPSTNWLTSLVEELGEVRSVLKKVLEEAARHNIDTEADQILLGSLDLLRRKFRTALKSVRSKQVQTSVGPRDQDLERQLVRDELLPILDQLEELQTIFRTSGTAEPVVVAAFECADAVRARFLSVLESFRITPFSRLGSRFESQVHELVEEVDSATVASGCIAAVHQRGYFIGSHILRPARVSIARRPAQTAAQDIPPLEQAAS